MDEEDLAGAGTYAVCRASREWDGRGCFARYAKQRAIWAMQELIRSRCWIPKGQMERIKKGEAEFREWDLAHLSLCEPLRAEVPGDQSEQPEPIGDALDDNTSLEARVLGRQLRLEIRMALNEYPGRPTTRTVLRLILLRGHRPGEVAQALGLSRKDVWNHYSAGLAYLRQRLADWEP